MNSPFFKEIDVNASTVDAGLRAHMLRIYNYMGCGLAMTGVVAYIISTSEALMRALFTSPVMSLLIIAAPVIVALFLSFRINKIEASTAQGLFWAYAGLMGLSMSSLFIVYTGASIASTFFITSSMFLAMSIYGYATDSDLSKMGSILIMGVVGLIVASLVNMFLHNSMLHFITSVLGVIIFTGLTAYDTQAMKSLYYESDSAEIASKKAVIGALTLYLDFVNLFINILRLIGVRRD